MRRGASHFQRATDESSPPYRNCARRLRQRRTGCERDFQQVTYKIMPAYEATDSGDFVFISVANETDLSVVVSLSFSFFFLFFVLLGRIAVLRT